jgi:hypothetical protein
MLAAPAVGDLEGAPPGQERTDLGHQAREVLGAGRRHAELQVRARVRHGDLHVSGEVPFEHFGYSVAGAGDVAVDRHRHDGDDPAHGAYS